MNSNIEISKLSEIIGFKVPLDGMISAISGSIKIDIIAFDKRLMEVYNYTGSMNDFILSKFGNEAFSVLESYS